MNSDCRVKFLSCARRNVMEGLLAIQFHSFLTSAVDGGELSNSCSGRFHPGNCLSVSPEFQDLDGFQSWSGSFVCEKYFLPMQEMKHAFIVLPPTVFN